MGRGLGDSGSLRTQEGHKREGYEKVTPHRLSAPLHHGGPSGAKPTTGLEALPPVWPVAVARLASWHKAAGDGEASAASAQHRSGSVCGKTRLLLVAAAWSGPSFPSNTAPQPGTRRPCSWLSVAQAQAGSAVPLTLELPCSAPAQRAPGSCH